MEALSYIPVGLKVICLAFNKDIATDLEDRVPEGVEAKTFHSLGLRAVTGSFGRVKINKDRMWPFIDKAMPKDSKHEAKSAVKKLVGLGKNLWLTTEDELINAAVAFEIASKDVELPVIARYAWQVMEMAKTPHDMSVDFDDMIWLPCVLAMNFPLYDVVMIDETQDLNRCQLHAARQCAGKSGKIVAVGDRNQSIYKFRGADAQAIPRMIVELQAKVLPLSITYRCPRAVVALAQDIVPQLQAAPGAIEGEVIDVREKEMLEGAAIGDFILSRTNAPLVSICLRLLKRGVPTIIAGRDTGKMIVDLVRSSKAYDVPQLLDWLEIYKGHELERLSKLRSAESAIETLYDKIDTIVALTEGCRMVSEVVEQLETLFADDGGGRVICSTAHKAKGLETDNVWLIRKTFMKWPGVEESNLYYVAITRAKKRLMMVHL